MVSLNIGDILTVVYGVHNDSVVGIMLMMFGVSLGAYFFTGFRDPGTFIFPLVGCALSLLVIVVGIGIIMKRNWLEDCYS